MGRSGIALALCAAVACRGGGDGGDAGKDGAGDGTVFDGRIDGAPAPIEASSVRMCVLGSGAVVVVWVDARSGVPAVWARRSAEGGLSWPEPPTRINTATAAASEVDLGCAGETLVAAWEDTRDSEVEAASVYWARSTDGGASWQPDARLAGSELGLSDALGPRVAASGDDVHVAWYTDVDGSYDIYVASSRDAGATFGEATRLDTDPAGTAWSAHPEVAADADGRVLVAWEDRRSGVVDVYAAFSPDAGASWSADARVDQGDGDSYAPKVVLEAGEGYALWHDERDGDALEVYAARIDAGGWGSPLRLSAGDPGVLDSVLPAGLLRDGTLSAVWFQGADGGYHVDHLRLVDGVPDPTPRRLDHAPGEGRATYPLIAAEGPLHAVAWRDDRYAGGGESNDLYYVFSRDGGATWSDDLRLAGRLPGAGPAVDLALAVSGGDVLGAWVDGREGAAGVYFSRLPLGSEASPF